ncbi:hypothetical protein ABKN59_001651 [Abortiporus biennis]
MRPSTSVVVTLALAATAVTAYPGSIEAREDASEMVELVAREPAPEVVASAPVQKRQLLVDGFSAIMKAFSGNDPKQTPKPKNHEHEHKKEAEPKKQPEPAKETEKKPEMPATPPAESQAAAQPPPPPAPAPAPAEPAAAAGADQAPVAARDLSYYDLYERSPEYFEYEARDFSDFDLPYRREVMFEYEARSPEPNRHSSSRTMHTSHRPASHASSKKKGSFIKGLAKVAHHSNGIANHAVTLGQNIQNVVQTGKDLKDTIKGNNQQEVYRREYYDDLVRRVADHLEARGYYYYDMY